MNRRGFLGRLAAALGAAAIARELPAQEVEAPILSSDPADSEWKDNLITGLDPAAAGGDYSVVSSPSWCAPTFDGDLLHLNPSPTLTTGTYTGTIGYTGPFTTQAQTFPVTFTLTPKRKRGRRRGRR